MLTIIIKIFSIILCTVYIYNKLVDTQSISASLYSKTIPISLLLSIPAVLTYLTSKELTYYVPLLIFWIIASYRTSQPQKSFITLIISFSIGYSLHAAISFFVTLILYFCLPYTQNFPLEVLSISSSILQIAITSFLFKIKRFKNGMPFFRTKQYINLATFICIILVAISVYLTTNHFNPEIQLFGISTTTLALAFLIYWWQAQITKAYRRNLELRELESLRTELQEKNATMMRVMQENERIRRINHRDNGLITALDYAVNDYLISDFSDAATAKARREELLLEIERIRAGRTSSVNVDEVKSERYETSISLLNILLNHTSKRAIDEHVLLSVHIATELDTYIPRIISEDDFVHLLSDLLENAFVATKNVTSPMIQLQFYKWNKSLVIEVADNGIPFEIDSILNMGICELTTHADTGGSGIGLMDIWNTKEQCGATYHLEEYENPAPFSKKISLTFDKKNRYSVRTWRKDEILQKSKRVDLQVYDFSEQ